MLPGVPEVAENVSAGEVEDSTLPGLSAVSSSSSSRSSSPSPPQPELRYVNMLNSVLPRSIRILAWSPVADDFDARFSCTSRHYKYFFTRSIPTFPHITLTDNVSSRSDPQSTCLLDIQTMQDAASRLVGIHDFRHFAKMDPSKQIENFSREIYEAKISSCTTSPVPNHAPIPSETTNDPATQMYVLDLKGNGFLWHQVRHIMSLLFLIGSGLEKPALIDALFNTGFASPNLTSNAPTSNVEASSAVISTKPTYEMADGLPLVLWDCGYKPTDVSWRIDSTLSTNPSSASNRKGNAGQASASAPQHIYPPLHHLSQQHLIKHTLLNHFASAASTHHPPPSPLYVAAAPMGAGTGTQASRSKYIKVLDRPRGEDVRELNEKWKTGAGARKAARKAAEKVKADQLAETGAPLAS